MADRVEMVVADVARYIGMRAEEDWMNTFDQARRLCESPIEVMMLASISRAARHMRMDLLPGSLSEFWVSGAGRSHDEDLGVDGVWVCPQAKIGAYRVDFLLRWVHSRSKSDFCIVVECDGHDYHDRTKEQARRDKSRDRDLLVNFGCQVMRFTGSEIYRSPEECGVQALTPILEAIHAMLCAPDMVAA